VRAFEYLRASDVHHAVATAAAGQEAAYLAGGTTQVDLMKDGVLGPDVLIDITRLPLRGVVPDGGAVRVGAGNYGGKLGPHHYHLRDLLP